MIEMPDKISRCGCGGEGILVNDPIYKGTRVHPDTKEEEPVMRDVWNVECEVCGVQTGMSIHRDIVIKDWNVAIGGKIIVKKELTS